MFFSGSEKKHFSILEIPNLQTAFLSRTGVEGAKLNFIFVIKESVSK